MGRMTDGDEGRGPRRAQKRGLSPLTVLGVVLLVAGLGCLGYVGWEFYGTTWISKRAADEERAGLAARWERPEAVQEEPTAGQAEWLLRIPALGDDYEWPIVAGVEPDDLTRGVGWYPTSALPGEIGNFALAGHRVTNGEPFRHLLDLEVGDEVIVETAEAIFTYEINSAPRELTVQDTESWVLLPVPGQEGVVPSESVITLTTCQDFFRSPDRSVGFGVLTDTELKK